MVSVGIVLGAGGVVGAAYHAGVLTALAEAGFDGADAEVIVGTSAGSGVGALIRAGFPTIDLANRNLGKPISAKAAAIVERTGGPPTFDLTPPTSRIPMPASPSLLYKAATRPGVALAGLLPSGSISTDAIRDRIDAVYQGQRWPKKMLWICAVDLDSGKRVVFGRDGIDVPVGVAVQASSAIPAFFKPVTHDGRRYVDGGVHSPTNADLLAGAGFDVVVVISPMSATNSANRTSFPSIRPMFARRLGSEVRQLRASGTEALTFQPTPAEVGVMGRNAMDESRRAPTTELALDSARTRLSSSAVAERLALLRTA